jgi:hypothetical protein
MNYPIMSEEKGRRRRRRRTNKTKRTPKIAPKGCLNNYMKIRTTWPSS